MVLVKSLIIIIIIKKLLGEHWDVSTNTCTFGRGSKTYIIMLDNFAAATNISAMKLYCIYYNFK